MKAGVKAALWAVGVGRPAPTEGGFIRHVSFAVGKGPRERAWRTEPGCPAALGPELRPQPAAHSPRRPLGSVSEMVSPGGTNTGCGAAGWWEGADGEGSPFLWDPHTQDFIRFSEQAFGNDSGTSVLQRRTWTEQTLSNPVKAPRRDAWGVKAGGSDCRQHVSLTRQV